jgi:hypothetical protein
MSHGPGQVAGADDLVDAGEHASNGESLEGLKRFIQAPTRLGALQAPGRATAMPPYLSWLPATTRSTCVHCLPADLAGGFCKSCLRHGRSGQHWNGQAERRAPAVASRPSQQATQT